MFKKNASYICFWAVLLILVFAGVSSVALAAQTEADKATAKLKVLSESMDAGDIAQIRDLVKAGADVNVRNKYGATSLYLASHKGHTDVVKLLLEADANVNAAQTNGYTPLWVASEKGHADIVKLLLKAGANIKAKAHVGGKDYTPLSIAKHEGHDEIVRLLLEEAGAGEIVRLLLEEAGADANITRASDGDSALMMASQEGNIEAVRLLLEAGVNANITYDTGIAPLFVASWNGHVDIVKMLLKAGVDVNTAETAETDGFNSLMVASQKGYTDIVKLLLEAKADNNAFDNKGNTPLLLASENGYSEIVKLLLEAGANVNAADIDGTTPLLMASQQGYTEVVKLLLEAKANVNIPHINGGTPLIMASQNGYIEIVNAQTKRATLAKNRYSDSNGYFKIIPPDGWRIQKYPEDHRGKVAFIGPDGVELRVLVKGLNHSSFEEMLKEIKEIEKQIGTNTNIEKITFSSEPAVKRVFTLKGIKILFIDFMIGEATHNIMYSASPTEFEKYLSVAQESINTYEPTLVGISPEDIKKHAIARSLRLSQIFFDQENYNLALEYINEGLEVQPNNTNLLELKNKILGSMDATQKEENINNNDSDKKGSSGDEDRFSIVFQPANGSDTVGSITFMEMESSGYMMMSTERPGDSIMFALGGSMQATIGTGEGSEIRFLGTISLGADKVIGEKNSRLSFRKADGEWAYVSGLGQYESEGKVTKLGHNRTVDSCLKLLTSEDLILRGRWSPRSGPP